MSVSRHDAEVVVVGAGAAGLATAVFAARAGAGRVVCVDGARHIGAKILVSGGGRCNVTNRVVTERDFWGGSSRIVRAVLRAFPDQAAAAFFEQEGVRLHEEEDGKLFPDSGRARDVVDALLTAAAHGGVDVVPDCRVRDVVWREGMFLVSTASGVEWVAPRVVLATGGRSLPKSGSDGAGYGLARALGHTLVETTPALVPLIVDDEVCARLAGVAHDSELTLEVNGRVAIRRRGSMLWTHFGISGPAALDISRHWLHARLMGADPRLHLSVCPGDAFDAVEHWLLARSTDRPKAQVTTVLAERVTQALAEAWTERAGVDASARGAHLDRDARRRLVHVLTDTVLPVRDSRGYNYAEVTAGGVTLDEIDAATMESRVRPGLHLVGEILDVDGRLGGFNFQWAWSSGWVAGQALGRARRHL